VKVLVEAGAEVEAVDDDGLTSLHFAAKGIKTGTSNIWGAGVIRRPPTGRQVNSSTANWSTGL
jgi:hypothetical protein